MINNILAALLFTCAVNDTTITLGDVTVNGQRSRDFQMQTSQSVLQVNRDFLSQNFAGSLMQTLEGIPGVKAMSIGSGQSKPAIRGLGFNRLAVSEDGIKHEGQQWGDDHGLEIDQFAIDRAEIIKGPAALLYGSDAIGGVLSLYTNHLPTKPVEGAVQMFGRSNNEQLGLSAKIGGRSGRFFYRANMTLIDYADYSVTTDSIQYYSYWIRLKDRRLRNTAGTERDGSITVGYAGYRFHTDIRVADNFSKSGFFANAHGLEVRLSDIDYDSSRRDIDLPYQQVNHLKVISHTSWNSDVLTADLSLAYQNNQRKETSEPMSHGYMPQPDGPIERQFNKSTYTGNFWLRLSANQHTLQGGVNTELQHNRRDGWGFIIPDFESTGAGIYLSDRYALSQQLIFNAGVRFDHVRTHIHDYYDWYETPVDGIPTFKQRSADMRKSMNSLTWSAGVNYSTGNWLMKANVGKSFRMPIPKELGTNGVNYHIFRYEQGNPQLDPEESYQLDASIGWGNAKVEILVDPFVNYFPNFIYLNPTARFVEGLQLYHYTQARVIRYGAEAQFTWNIAQDWQLLLQGEYLYARQQSGEKKGYTLPFSTPWSVDAGVKYSFDFHGKGFMKLNAHIVSRQNEIVPPEQPTGGYYTLNFSAGKYISLKSTMLNVALHADNLLNRRFYDHTSYYRLIDVPEPGRNLSLKVGLEF
ncbi:MAG: TonB-dependent receptor [Prevotella sp.]|nr:TonB-dependent receptor [Prevotella sp.]MBR1462136.1 TonB-dependent receptor [Prevotella sp.]